MWGISEEVPTIGYGYCHALLDMRVGESPAMYK